MKKNIILLFLLFATLSWSQSRKAYERLFRSFSKVQFSNPELSKQYLDSILVLPKLPDSLVSKTQNDIGIYHALVGDYDNALLHFVKAYNSESSHNKQSKANILCNIANTQKLFGKFDLALQNLDLAKKLYTALDDEKNILKVESEISAVYYAKSNYNKALELSTELLPQLEKLGDKRLYNIQLLRQANIQFNIGDYEGAITNYKLVLPFFSVNEANNLQNKYVALMNIGESYAELNRKEALDYFNLSLKGFREITDKRNEHFCLSRIGKYYYRNGNFRNALSYLKTSFDYLYTNLPHLSLEVYTYYIGCQLQLSNYTALNEILKYNTSEMIVEANPQEKIFYFETLALYYAKVGDTKNHFDVLKKLQKFYHDRDKNNSFEALQKKLNLYELNTTIDKNKNLELQVSNLKLQNAVVLVSILLLVLLIVFLIDKQRKKNKIQQLILAQLEQEKMLHEKRAKLKEVELQYKTEITQTKERELTALQLKIYQVKEKILDYLSVNEFQLDKKILSKITKEIVRHFDNDDYWKEFQLKFANMHPDFIATIKSKYPNLTKKDIDFLILIKLNLSNKEMATLINISYESVISKRYLIRKKMSFSSDNELVEFLHIM